MSARLEGKVIVVAGAGGIGNGLVARYAAEGARVIVGDIRPEAADEAADRADGSGEQVIPTLLDGADATSVDAIVALAMARFGRIDGFHVNFAYLSDTHQKWGVVDMPIEEWDRSMAVNARGSVICTQKAVPAMIASGGGAMVYTSSADAFRGAPVRVAYQMGKSAIHALMRHTASRYGRKGIRANVVSPGLILHDAQRAKLKPEFLALLKEDAGRLTAFPDRFGTPGDIAAVSAMLMSDDASYITGQIINVDGALTMRN